MDDEPLARRRILSLLKTDSNFEAMAECSDGASGIRAIVELRPDLVYLDVQMPGTDGFGVLEEVAAVHLPAIIFVTAYDQYAVRAFDEHAVDYLLKPFKRDRFMESLERAKKSILRNESGRSGSSAIAEKKLLPLLRRVGGDRGRFVIRTDGKIVFLRSAEVEWIEAAANYVRVHAGQRVYPVREKIGDFEQTLPADKFIRIHRCVIVNLDAISEIQSYGAGEHIVLLRSGKELPMGRTYRDALTEMVNKSR